MRRKRVIQRAVARFRGQRAWIDGARPRSGTESIMDGSGYLRDVVIAARRRMDRNFAKEQSQASPSWLHRVIGERIVRWYKHLVKRFHSASRSNPAGPVVNASPTASDQPIVSDASNRGARVAFDIENDRLRKALALLEPEDLELLMMRHVDQTNITQIALTLGITEKAVKERLLRALLSLRERMEP